MTPRISSAPSLAFPGALPRSAGSRALGWVAGLLWVAIAGAQQTELGTQQAEDLARHAELAAPYVPTPSSVVAAMLELAGITKDDMVVDLGSGDGRIVVEAAKRYGARGLGIDISPGLVKLANQRAEEAGVGDRVKFFVGDLFKASLSQASVVFVYLLPSTVTRLVPKLYNDLAPGTRVVSHDYELTPLKPQKRLELDVPEKAKITGTARTFIYLYVIAAPVQGRWTMVLPQALGNRQTFVFEQQFDRVTGYLDRPDGRAPLGNVSLSGNGLSFVVPALASHKDVPFQLAVRGAELDGTATIDGLDLQVTGFRDRGGR